MLGAIKKLTSEKQTRNIRIMMAWNSSEWKHLKTSFHKFLEQVPPNWDVILLLKAIKWTFTSKIPRIYCGTVLVGSAILAPCYEFFGDNGAANWKNFKYNLKCDAIEAKKNFNSAWKQIPDRKLVLAFLKKAGITLRKSIITAVIINNEEAPRFNMSGTKSCVAKASGNKSQV